MTGKAAPNEKFLQSFQHQLAALIEPVLRSATTPGRAPDQLLFERDKSCHRQNTGFKNARLFEKPTSDSSTIKGNSPLPGAV